MAKIDMTKMEKSVAAAKQALAMKAANRGQQPYMRNGKLVRGHGEQDGKTPSAIDVANRRAIELGNLQKVKDVYGKTQFLDKRELDEGRDLLRVYDRNGRRVTRRDRNRTEHDISMHRDNILSLAR